MTNTFGWLGRGTTPWEFLNQLISHLSFNTTLIGYQHSAFCHCGIPRFTFCNCESTLSLYATYCHKLQLSIKTITRTDTHTHQHISHISYIHTYTHETKTTSTSYVKSCWIKSLLLVLHFFKLEYMAVNHFN